VILHRSVHCLLSTNLLTNFIFQISKALRASYGAKLIKAGPAAKKFFGFSGSSLNKHIKLTSKSIYKAKFSGAKYGKFIKGAGRVMGVASIGKGSFTAVFMHVKHNLLGGICRVRW